ncbi:Folylpolyglutamate synthetase [Synechococcus sp. CC9902]|uniref:bifunctional folylpolyglutamate synthase/dihydrofolate synthase n=1 Tax=Synechococcus sp. (strain CC9902) TaxID=316279 RepID=UPI00005D4281|nr:dihydrofolate synthase [Synechococcus sp. CC9902]ABB26493.1 Folylpolyglutamate synthetase [Synechococcus sp. CC9902]
MTHPPDAALHRLIQRLLPPFEQRGMDLSLERMHRVLSALGDPCGNTPAVQVVGTNGKGSIACMIHSGLSAAGVNSGLTTSPHLVSWCERICINQTPITQVELHQRLQALEPFAEEHHLTTFERLITAALMHFEAHDVDWLVLEAGLGGRLDATTAHPQRPLIAVGAIGIDHREHLGNTLTAISREKAAAISPGAHVISAAQLDPVRAVLEEHTRMVGATLEWVEPLPDAWDLGLPGTLQRHNGAVAYGALQEIRRLGANISEQSIREGLAKAHWPGRLQTVLWNERPIRLDGAHNPAAAAQLAQERACWCDRQQAQIWILGIQAHKQAPEMLQLLLEPNDFAWIIPVPGHQSWTLDRLSEACPNLANQMGGANDVLEVLNRLVSAPGSWPNPSPLIAGSLYLLGELMAQRTIEAK